MKITDDLKLAIPLRSIADGVEIYAYHVPISREVFESNYRLLAGVKSELAGKGAHYLMSAGPRIASLALMDEAKKESSSNGNFDEAGNPDCSSAKAFLMEIKRLTTVLIPGPSGWDMLPIDAAISSGKIDAEEWQEVESNIVFFTCHYSLARRSEREITANATASLLMGACTSLPPSEFVASLPGLMTEKPSENTAI